MLHHLFYPCLITEVSVRADMELRLGEEKGTPSGAIPTFVKLKKKQEALSISDEMSQHLVSHLL